MPRLNLAFLAICSLLVSGYAQADYHERLAGAKARCEAIPRTKSHTGLWFNPRGYRSYFERSMCYQGLALNFRQPALCRKVRQRHSLFGSSWGYSRQNCSKLVREAITQDAASIEKLRDAYRHNPVQLIEVTVRQDGNGRDIDVLPVFSAGTRQTYRFSAFIVDARGKRHRLVEQTFRLGQAKPSIVLFVKREQVIRAVPGFGPSASQLWAFELELAPPVGRGNALWPPAWLENLWPRAQRVQIVESRQAVERWRPVDP